MIATTHIPNLGLKIELASRTSDKGTDITVYNHTDHVLMTSVIATDIADKLAIGGAVLAKLAYNATREDHKRKVRNAPGGKSV